MKANEVAIGSVIGMRYRITSMLGRGGMGTVYKAIHVGLGKPVALKLLHKRFAGGEFEARFEREARAVARLDHPSCVRVLDFGKTADQKRFLAMEFIAGPSLAQTLDHRGKLSSAHAIHIASDVLQALAHARRAGVVHRDVKPANVMFARRDNVGRAVLIDFGLARLQDHSPLTRAGFCMGSPSYLAPERLLGRLYDHRADLYSVGVMLYEMLSGVRPFRALAPEDVARQHIRDAPTPLAQLCPSVSASLAAIAHRALEKDPECRFADAQQMISALARVHKPRLATKPVPPPLPAVIRDQQKDEATTMLMAQIVPIHPSLLRRLWGWLRHGSWRWRRGSEGVL